MLFEKKMTNIIRSNFQDSLFHFVSPSPWPLYMGVCFFNLTTAATLSLDNINNAYYLFYISLSLVVSSMCFWYIDQKFQGKFFTNNMSAVHKKVINFPRISLELRKNLFDFFTLKVLPNCAFIVILFFIRRTYLKTPLEDILKVTLSAEPVHNIFICLFIFLCVYMLKKYIIKF